jgi:hypothetical protein
MRVVFQMTRTTPSSLIDSPKASTLGLHAHSYNESMGLMETFRPYATPDAEWIEHAAAALKPAKWLSADQPITGVRIISEPRE